MFFGSLLSGHNRVVHSFAQWNGLMELNRLNGNYTLFLKDASQSRVGLAQRYHARLRGERSGFNAQFQQPEITLGNTACDQQKSAGDDRSTLTLKLMGRVI